MFEQQFIFLFFDNYSDRLKKFVKEKEWSFTDNFKLDSLNEIYLEPENIRIYCIPINYSSIAQEDKKKIEDLNVYENSKITIFDEEEFYIGNDFYSNFKIDEYKYLLGERFDIEKHIVPIFYEEKENLALDEKNIKQESILVSDTKIIDTKNKNENNKVYIVIIGKFSQGKTTLINQLVQILSSLEKEDYEKNYWLVSGLEETTMTLFEIHFSQEIISPKMYIDNEEKGDIKEYFGKNKENKSFPAKSNIKIIFPLKRNKPFYNIFSNIVFIDTPGTNSPNNTFKTVKDYLISNYDKAGYLFILKDNHHKSEEDKIKDFLSELTKRGKYNVIDIISNRWDKEKDGLFDKEVFKFKNLCLKELRIESSTFYVDNTAIIIKMDKIDRNLYLLYFFIDFYYKILAINELNKLKEKHSKYILDQKKKKFELEAKKFEEYGSDFNLYFFFEDLFSSIFNSSAFRKYIENIFSKLESRKKNSLNPSVNLNLEEIDVIKNTLSNIFNTVKESKESIIKVDNYEFYLNPVIKELRLILADKYFDSLLNHNFINLVINLLNKNKNINYIKFITKSKSSLQRKIVRDNDFKNKIEEFDNAQKNFEINIKKIDTEIERVQRGLR